MSLLSPHTQVPSNSCSFERSHLSSFPFSLLPSAIIRWYFGSSRAFGQNLIWHPREQDGDIRAKGGLVSYIYNCLGSYGQSVQYSMEDSLEEGSLLERPRALFFFFFLILFFSRWQPGNSCRSCCLLAQALLWGAQGQLCTTGELGVLCNEGYVHGSCVPSPLELSSWSCTVQLGFLRLGWK